MFAAAKNASMNNCGLKSPSRKTLVRTFPIVGSIISTLAVIFRLIARLPRFGGKFGADDWTIILSNVRILFSFFTCVRKLTCVF
jgi:hypothetical protein